MPARKLHATKQGTLSFTAGKRTTSTGTKGKASRPTLKRAVSSPAEPSTPDVIEIDDSDNDTVGDDIESEDDYSPDVDKQRGKRKLSAESESDDDEEHMLKRRKVRVTNKGVFGSRDGTENIGRSDARAAPTKAKARGAKARASLDESDAAAKALRKKKGELDDLPKDGRWRKHYGAVREKMGNLEPVHGEDQSPVDHILRIFDLSYEYGPCIGVTRLERWNRAEALGLSPPPEVKEILMTKEGSDNPRFTECVFNGEV